MRVGRWSVLAVVLVSATAWSCDVPVYRWALERWEADPYEAIVFHEGPASAEVRACIDLLEDGRTEGANIRVTAVDLADNVSPAMTALWESQTSAEAPWLLLRFPHTVKGQPAAWSGALTAENCQRMLHSGARRALAEDLTEDDAGVFIFLASGDQARDGEAEAVLSAALAKAEEHLELPTGTTKAAPQMDDALLDELDVSFSMVKVARDDPAEAVLVSSLLGLEPDLRGLDGPMVFPVFGRGRALYALVDRGINKNTVAEACSFIVGSCTCQVKDLNPGTDLLIAANWDDELDMMLSIETLVEVLPRPSEMVAAANTADETAPSPPQSSEAMDVAEPAQATPAEEGGNVMLNVGLVVLAGLIVVVAASLFLVYRKQGAR